MAFLISEHSLGAFNRRHARRTMAGGGPPHAGCAAGTRSRSRGNARGGGPKLGWLWIVLLIVAAVLARAGAPPARESDVKAVYVLRFAEYVDWPPESFAGPESPIIIGVLGD